MIDEFKATHSFSLSFQPYPHQATEKEVIFFSSFPNSIFYSKTKNVTNLITTKPIFSNHSKFSHIPHQHHEASFLVYLRIYIDFCAFYFAKNDATSVYFYLF